MSSKFNKPITCILQHIKATKSIINCDNMYVYNQAVNL